MSSDGCGQSANCEKVDGLQVDEEIHELVSAFTVGLEIFCTLQAGIEVALLIELFN